MKKTIRFYVCWSVMQGFSVRKLFKTNIIIGSRVGKMCVKCEWGKLCTQMVSYFFNLLLIFLSMVGKKIIVLLLRLHLKSLLPIWKKQIHCFGIIVHAVGAFFDALWTFLRARNLDNLIKWWTVNVVHYRVNRGWLQTQRQQLGESYLVISYLLLVSGDVYVWAQVWDS